MSAYDPPSENIGVFNSSLFTSTSENITQSYADTHYLKYPTAQSATETINSLIATNLTATNNAVINSLTIGKGNNTSSTAIGINALLVNNVGSLNNTAVGYETLEANTGGNNNTAIGSKSLNFNTNGDSNTAIGYNSGSTNTIGDNNTYVGFNADASGNNYSNSTALGAGAQITASNQIVLGTASETVRYNLLQPLYTSLSTLTNDYVGYVETESNTTIATINTGYQVLMTTQTLPVGIYIYMISQVFQSASTALILETKVRFSVATRHITIDSVASGGSRTITMTGFLQISSGTGYMDFSAKTSTGTMTAYQTDPDYTALRMIRIA